MGFVFPDCLSGLVGLEDLSAPYDSSNFPFNSSVVAQTYRRLKVAKRLFSAIVAQAFEEIDWTPIRLRRWLRVKR